MLAWEHLRNDFMKARHFHLGIGGKAHVFGIEVYSWEDVHFYSCVVALNVLHPLIYPDKVYK